MNQSLNIGIHLPGGSLWHLVSAQIIADHKEMLARFAFECCAYCKKIASQIVRSRTCANDTQSLITSDKEQRIDHCNKVGGSVGICICMDIMFKADFSAFDGKQGQEGRKKRVDR